MGIRALGYLVIGTRKPEEWSAFLTGIVGAMDAGRAADGASLYRIDDRAFRFRIEPGENERLLAAAYEVADADALADLKEHVSAAGRPVTDGSPGEARERGVAAFFRTCDPAGHGLEFFHGNSRSDTPFVSPEGVSGFVTRDMGMGHVVYATPDFNANHAFYRDVIGFGDTDIPRFHFSDDPGDPGMGFAFMHADNGRHHSVALGEMPDPPSGCVHIMLEMQSMADVGKCHDRMRQAGIVESATLGRHLNDQTFGFYMQTPSGFDIEIGCDPLVIDWQNWTPTAHLQPSEWGHEWAWQKAMRLAEAAQ